MDMPKILFVNLWIFGLLALGATPTLAGGGRGTTDTGEPVPGPIGPPGLVGPTGPSGATGPQGLIGPPGPIGPPGATGPSGPQGLVGPSGPPGSQGLIGPPGAVGSVGATGPQGLVGPPGPIGATGAIGPAGPIGPAGSNGIGIQGIQGSPGPVGPVGPIGPAGPIGSDPRFGNNTNVAAEGRGRECTLGEIILSAGSVANGILANGQLLPISQNTALFALLGNTYGGDGRSTFALPDLRSAAPNGLTYSVCFQGIFPSRN